jgi:serine protease inhibitor
MNKTILWSFLLFFSGSQTSRATDQKIADFAVDLYKAISLSHKNNIIFSPLGTTMLLGMVQLGAKGKAQQQILKTLRMRGTPAGEHLACNSLLIQSL